MSSHPKTHIFSFNLSLNAPWFEKLAFEKNTMYFTLVILQSSIEKNNHVQVIPIWYGNTIEDPTFCELLALTRWPHIFLYFSLTECQKSCSHPMTPHFLSLCSHRIPQPVGGRALHPYPLHIWLPPPPGKEIGKGRFLGINLCESVIFQQANSATMDWLVWIVRQIVYKTSVFFLQKARFLRNWQGWNRKIDTLDVRLNIKDHVH